MVGWFMVSCVFVVLVVVWLLGVFGGCSCWLGFDWLLFGCVCCLLMTVACDWGLLVNGVDFVVSLLLLFCVWDV